MIGRARGLMEAAGCGCWLKMVGKGKGGRGECLGCTIAGAPADEVVAFSASVYPPERD